MSVDAAKRDLVDRLMKKSFYDYINGQDDALWREQPDEYDRRIAELDSALTPGFGFGGHKISARYDLFQSKLRILRAEIEVIRAAVTGDKTKKECEAAQRVAKKMMRDAIDTRTRALADCVYRREI